MAFLGSVRRRRGLVAAGAALVLLGTGALQATGAYAAPVAQEQGESARAGATPPISLLRATKEATVPQFEGTAYLDLGIFAVAGDDPFEVRVTRPSYQQRLRAVLERAGGDQVLQQGLAREDFAGLNRFFQLTVQDRAGRAVVNRKLTFCPNSYQQVRRRVEAPSASRYPFGCEANRYALGQVWGLQAGWATPALEQVEARLKPGRYRATVSINPRYVKALGLTSGTSATVRMKVVEADEEEFYDYRTTRARTERRAERRAVAARAQAVGEGRPSAAALRRTPQVAAAGAAGAPAVDPSALSDLRSLPAWGIQMEGNQLQFSATVWNAGPSPLVVDAFRRGTDSDLMDAHQYFFDADGTQVGHAPVGTMEWDARDGHNHWHFTDFASYRLLDADKKLVVRSRKEAFCLANTDAVDYSVAGANWRPDNTDLHTSCGDRGSVAVRQTLETGSGDTYAQFLPGQSFNIRSLPNGVYYIQVLANPENALHESSTTNNSALRRIALGGKPGKRTVRVSKVGVITEPAIDDEGEEEHRRAH